MADDDEATGEDHEGDPDAVEGEYTEADPHAVEGEVKIGRYTRDVAHSLIGEDVTRQSDHLTFTARRARPVGDGERADLMGLPARPKGAVDK